MSKEVGSDLRAIPTSYCIELHKSFKINWVSASFLSTQDILNDH